MRKLTVLLMVLGLALMATSALAVGLGPNELVNGDFSGGLTGWTPIVDGHLNFNVYDNPTRAGIISASNGDEHGIFQVIDESLFPGWLPNGTGKQIRFDADVNVLGAGNTAEFYIFAFNTNPALQPAFSNPDDPNLGWTKLVDGEVLFPAGGYFYGPVSGSVTASGTLDWQPRWIAIALETQINNPSGGEATWANVDFEAKCVPVPPAVWLFGSGLLGLFGWRKFKA